MSSVIMLYNSDTINPKEKRLQRVVKSASELSSGLKFSYKWAVKHRVKGLFLSRHNFKNYILFPTHSPDA